LNFYRIGDDSIDVLHVLHGAMDYEPLLFPEG
jgi:toxin ParE1/3/4